MRPGRRSRKALFGWLPAAALLLAGLVGPVVADSGTAEGATAAWQVIEAFPRADTSGISCPTPTTCAVIGVTKGATDEVGWTHDGGTTWTRHRFPHLLEPNSQVPLPLQAISCASPVQCVVVGGNINGDPAPDDAVALFTTDGGAHWQISRPPLAQFDSVSCPDTTDCEAVGIAGGQPWATPPDVFATRDGGRTWQGQAALGALLSDVSCASDSVCAVVGGYPKHVFVATTRHGGRSWTVGTPPKGPLFFPAIACPTTTSCLAVGGHDGTGSAAVIGNRASGTQWASQPLPSGAGGLFGISCGSSHYCEAVGGGRWYFPPTSVEQTPPTALVTTGGGTWHAQPLPTAIRSLSSVSCPSADVCFSLGSDGTHSVMLRYGS